MRHWLIGPILLALSLPALAWAPWYNGDVQIHGWFDSVKQPPGYGASCCAEADAVEADAVEGETPQGDIVAVVTNGHGVIVEGTRVDVPRDKIVTRYGNPTGHIVLFVGTDDEGDIRVLCYVPLPGV